MAKEGSAEGTIRDIRRKTRRKYNAEEKIRIVVEGLRGETTIAELCRREGISESLYYSWSKEFMEAGKARLSGNTQRQASSREVDQLLIAPRRLLNFYHGPVVIRVVPQVALTCCAEISIPTRKLKSVMLRHLCCLNQNGSLAPDSLRLTSLMRSQGY
jgi:transposase